ncbi:ABC transporter substrate-binding protein [Deinococcus pimensis]|uniref:ABC transporter substrate-binding protein n=1 Tax=Deinococcus pimensis TaxID=309888 RepID=UPI000A073C49|nr:ABC transporter substrate-binding protein [Deinococcus pimensis]
MTKRVSGVVTALLSSLSVLGGAHAASLAEIRASGTIRLATSADFPPFNAVENGRFTGFEVELGNRLAARLGVKPLWVKYDFDDLLRDLPTNQYDLVIASHAITSGRALTVDFTNAHSCTGGVILTREGGPVTSRDLAGKRVGVESGSTYFGWLNKLPFQKNVKVYSASDEAALALLAGQVDATVTDRLVALDIRARNPGARLVTSDLLWTEAIGMAVEKGNADLRRAVNTALAELMNGGEYATLSRRYFGEDIRCVRR